MGIFVRLRLYRALSGLIIDCVSTFPQGVALGSCILRLWRWIEIVSCPEGASYRSPGRSPGTMKSALITQALKGRNILEFVHLEVFNRALASANVRRLSSKEKELARYRIAH